MANTKELSLRARVPFDWASNLTDEEARVWVGWTVGPHGLDVRHQSAGSVPSKAGGVLMMYEVHVSGVEAISMTAMAIMRSSIERQECATLIESRFYDMDDGGVGPFDWPTLEEDRRSKARAKARVDMMTQGKTWATVKTGPGELTSALVNDPESGEDCVLEDSPRGAVADVYYGLGYGEGQDVDGGPIYVWYVLGTDITAMPHVARELDELYDLQCEVEDAESRAGWDPNP
jgi:hypothetical protein